MAFLLYSSSRTNGLIRYERVQALKLGGASGPIAQHVSSLRGDDAEKGWELEPVKLMRLSGLPAGGEESVILFEVLSSKPNAVCLYRLRRLCGVARDRKTQLSLDLEVLVDEVVNTAADEFKLAFALAADRVGKRLREVLQLSGGPGGGDWRWEEPAMRLGATLVSRASLGTK